MKFHDFHERICGFVISSFLLFGIYLTEARISAESSLGQLATRRSYELLANCSQFSPESYTPTCQMGDFTSPNCQRTNIGVLLWLEHFFDLYDVEETSSFAGAIRFQWDVACPAYKNDKSESIYVDEDYFWKPHINHKNAVTNTDMSDGFNERFIVITSGAGDSLLSFVWVKTGIFQSTCEMDHTTFPFDRQNCSVEFFMQEQISTAAFQNATSQIHVKFMPRSSGWYFEGITQSADIIEFNGLRGLAIFTLTLKRNPAFFVYSLMMPCALLTSLELSAFLMVPSLPDRPVFTMSIVLALTLLQGEILDRVPPKPHRIFISDYTDMSIVFAWACTIYAMASCGYVRAWPKRFKAPSGYLPVTCSRFIDIVAASLATSAFVAINLYALLFGLRESAIINL